MRSNGRLDLKTARDKNAALKQLVELGEAYGFNLVAFLEPSWRSDPGSTTNAPQRENVGPVILLLQTNRVQSLPLTNPIEDWPIVAHSAKSEDAFIWRPGDPKYFAYRQFGNKYQVRVRTFFRRFRVNAAVTTPVHLENEKFGFVSWFCCATAAPPESDWQEILKPLREAAREFLTTVPTLPTNFGIDRDDQLSDREMECLRWIALGRSTEETSELIGRSIETVRFHLKNAIKKLRANNRVHAVAIASHRHLLGELIDITKITDPDDLEDQQA